MNTFLRKIFGIKDPTPPPKKFWVGTISMPWSNKTEQIIATTYINLYEDENGVRSYKAHGAYTSLNDPSLYNYHNVFARIVVPYLGGCNLDFISKSLGSYNVDYWRSKGYDVSSQVMQPDVYFKKEPKPKPKANSDGKIIAFPKDSA